MRRVRLLPCALAALLLSACSDKPEPTQDPQPQRDPDELPAPICGAGTKWKAGQPAFLKATDKAGLYTLKVEGPRLNVADLDGDGFPDLVVRRVGNPADATAAASTRFTWVLRNRGDGTFEDVTESSGFVQTRSAQATPIPRPGEVVAFADVDNDGDLDGYTGLTTSIPERAFGETSELLLNDGKGRFELGPADSALRRAADVDVPAGAAFIDYDLDGLVDLWVGQHNYDKNGGTIFTQDRLYRNLGGAKFADVTEASRLTTAEWTNLDNLNEAKAHSRAWSAAACDLNDDGLPELLVASYGRAPNHLWQGARTTDGKVVFVNRSVASGYAYDDQQDWTDNQFARCYCPANPTAPGCAGLPASLLDCSQPNWAHSNDRQAFRLGGNSGATTCADINNDGHLDLLTSEIKHWWAGENADGAEVLLNTGEKNVKLTRPGRASMGIEIPHNGISWDEGIMTNTVFDFDNDGWPDLYLGASDYPGNRGLLYHQTSPLQFEEVALEAGVDHNRSHGVAIADFDRDGDLDLMVGHSRSRCAPNEPNDCYPTTNVRYFENVAGQGGNFVQLDLEGAEGTNRAAIGARVTVKSEGVTQTQEVSGGNGHYGAQNDRVLHFGLGKGCRAEVTVRWPNAELTTETFDLPAGYRFKLKQGEKPKVIP